MPRCTVTVETPIRDSFRVQQVIGMVERGLLASVSGGLDAILQRIRSAARES